MTFLPGFAGGFKKCTVPDLQTDLFVFTGNSEEITDFQILDLCRSKSEIHHEIQNQLILSGKGGDDGADLGNRGRIGEHIRPVFRAFAVFVCDKTAERIDVAGPQGRMILYACSDRAESCLISMNCIFGQRPVSSPAVKIRKVL